MIEATGGAGGGGAGSACAGGSEETPDGSSEKHVSRSDDVQTRLDAKTDLATAADTGLQGAGNGDRGYAQIDARIRDLQATLDAEERERKRVEQAVQKEYKRLEKLKDATSTKRVEQAEYKRLENQKFGDFLRIFRLSRQEIEAFGNCQFLSLAQQLLLWDRISRGVSRSITLDDRARLGKTLRTDSVRYMQHEDNRLLFEPFVAPQEGMWNALDSCTDG